MARQEARWVYQIGSGCIYTGSGWIVGVVAFFNAAADQVYVADGVDVGSAKRMLRLVESAQRTLCASLLPGYRFERGIYLSMTDKDCSATILFEPDL